MRAHDLADLLEDLVRRLRLEPAAASAHERAFEVTPGLVLEVPASGVLRKRRHRALHRGVPVSVPVSVPRDGLRDASAPATPEVRPASGAAADHARGHQISGSVSGSGPEKAKEYTAVAEGSDRSSHARDAAAAAMTADWEPPETLLAQLEISPGIKRPVSRAIMRPAILHFAQDPEVRKTPRQWAQIMSRWVCRDWGDPRKRAAAMAAASEQPQVGGFHEGPVRRLDPPAEWTAGVRLPVLPAPPEAVALAARLRAGVTADGLGGVADADRPAAGILAQARRQSGGTGG